MRKIRISLRIDPEVNKDLAALAGGGRGRLTIAALLLKQGVESLKLIRQIEGKKTADAER
jgi:hypothetical protein